MYTGFVYRIMFCLKRGSGSIVWAKQGGRKRRGVFRGFEPGRMESNVFGRPGEYFDRRADFLLLVRIFHHVCGHFITRADILLRLRILYQGSWQNYAWFYVKRLIQNFKKVKETVYIWTNTSYRLNFYNEIVIILHVITIKTEYKNILNSSYFFVTELEEKKNCKKSCRNYVKSCRKNLVDSM